MTLHEEILSHGGSPQKLTGAKYFREWQNGDAQVFVYQASNVEPGKRHWTTGKFRRILKYTIDDRIAGREGEEKLYKYWLNKGWLGYEDQAFRSTCYQVQIEIELFGRPKAVTYPADKVQAHAHTCTHTPAHTHTHLLPQHTSTDATPHASTLNPYTCS